MKFIVLLGRVFYSLIFISALPAHFSGQAVSYAAINNVPVPAILVPLSGITAFLGGLSVLIGFKTRAGAWLLVIFLVPVTLFMHRWWMVTDPMTQQVQEAMFFKNMAMLGCALLITYFGAGPASIDSARKAKTMIIDISTESEP